MAVGLIERCYSQPPTFGYLRLNCVKNLTNYGEKLEVADREYWSRIDKLLNQCNEKIPLMMEDEK
jgi:hypothetical protein